MNYARLTHEILFVFWSYGWVAVAYHQAKSQAAYIRGLLYGFLFVAIYSVFTLPLVITQAFNRERVLALLVVFVISALAGAKMGMSKSSENEGNPYLGV